MMKLNNGETTCKTFSGANGEKEHFLFIKPCAAASFEDQLKALEERYAAAQSSLGLQPGSAVFRRVFLSDVLNQEALVRQSALADPADPVALSIVQQPPLPGGRIALLAYHVQGRAPLSKRRLSPNHIIMERNGLGHLWSAGLCAGGGAASAEAQTRAVFAGLIGALESRGGSLEKHCVRTWIYLKNVDVFYQGMVDARRELFSRQGLTAATHYIASTGIEGACGGRLDLVGLDAYSVLGLDPRQVSYLNAFDRLCPTKDYNVTFERGTRVAYADRAHHFISGTASIDAGGRILHPGDALRQLERALENIEALLKSGKAALADLAHLTVYLRDPADFPRIGAYLQTNFPGLPLAAVRGAVCRPGWLVEVEGLAVTPNDEPALPSF